MLINQATPIEKILSEHPQDRVLIMHNKRTSRSVLATFSPVFNNALPDDTAVRAMFDGAFESISWNSTAQINPSDIPIINMLGGYRVTVVTKELDGRVHISDGEGLPVASYLGLE